MHPALTIAGQSQISSYAPLPADPADPSAGGPPVVIESNGALVVQAGMPRPESYWSAVYEAARGRTVAIPWGDQPHEQMLIEHGAPIDFVLSTAPDLPLDPRASYVSESKVRAWLEPSLDGLAKVIEWLGPIATGPILVAGSAPPIGDVDAVLARLPTDDRFAGTFAEGATAPIRISSPFTMQKLWSLLQTMTAAVAHGAGARFVPVPDRLRSTDGFLLPAFWGAGLVPGEAFGREMIAELTAAAAGSAV